MTYFRVKTVLKVKVPFVVHEVLLERQEENTTGVVS